MAAGTGLLLSRLVGSVKSAVIRKNLLEIINGCMAVTVFTGMIIRASLSAGRIDPSMVVIRQFGAERQTACPARGHLSPMNKPEIASCWDGW